MKISIITPCYNSVLTIEATIQSVLSQKNVDVEYIVIDGGSTDGTVDIIKKYSDKVFYWVSEKDNGIYDAMNKGIVHATGEVIGILNSDDFYVSDDVLMQVSDVLKQNDMDACYGDIVFVDKTNTKKVIRTWVSGEYKERRLYCGWIMPHPSVFIKTEIYKKYGLFRSDFKIAGDYELLLRLIKIHKISFLYIKKIMVCMRGGGASTKSLKQRILGWKELRKAWVINDLKFPLFFIARRILSKLTQFLNLSV